MGIIDSIKAVIEYIVVTTRESISLESTTREGRLTISIVLSLAFFFTFLALSGDIISASCLTAGLEIILLYTMSIL
jgi:hypothetical protein